MPHGTDAPLAYAILCLLIGFAIGLFTNYLLTKIEQLLPTRRNKSCAYSGFWHEGGC